MEHLYDTSGTVSVANPTCAVCSSCAWLHRCRPSYHPAHDERPNGWVIGLTAQRDETTNSTTASIRYRQRHNNGCWSPTDQPIADGIRCNGVLDDRRAIEDHPAVRSVVDAWRGEINRTVMSIPWVIINDDDQQPAGGGERDEWWHLIGEPFDQMPQP